MGELTVQVASGDVTKSLGTEDLSNIIQRGNYFAKDDGGALYYYEGGVYKRGGEQAVQIAYKQVLEYLEIGNKWTSAKAVEVTKYILIDAPSILEKPKVHKINLLNGIYNVVTKKLEEHDPSYRTTIQLPINYNPTAECKQWDKFIDEVFPNELGGNDLGYEVAAWLMVPWVKSQKCVVLLGSGANGKSIYSNSLKAFLGPHNCSSIALQKLGDRFTTAELFGKLANISTDLPNTKITNTSEFKNLVGGDALQGEYKNGRIFFFHPFARCLFACNELPISSSDHSDGFYRRLNVIEFDRQFENDPEKGAQLEKVLSQSEELSGLFNKAVKLLPKVLKHGITITEGMKNAIDEHRKGTDPTALWLEENTIEEAGVWIEKVDLFNEYKKSGDNVAAARNNVQFGKAIKRYRPKVMAKHRMVDGNFIYIYEGIRMKVAEDEVDWQASDFSLKDSDNEGELIQ